MVEGGESRGQPGDHIVSQESSSLVILGGTVTYVTLACFPGARASRVTFHGVKPAGKVEKKDRLLEQGGSEQVKGSAEDYR